MQHKFYIYRFPIFLGITVSNIMACSGIHMRIDEDDTRPTLEQIGEPAQAMGHAVGARAAGNFDFQASSNATPTSNAGADCGSSCDPICASNHGPNEVQNYAC